MFGVENSFLETNTTVTVLVVKHYTEKEIPHEKEKNKDFLSNRFPRFCEFKVL